MSKKDKLYDRIMTTPPRADIKYSELVTLLESYGFVLKEGSGSRVKFMHETHKQMISLHRPHPDNKCVKKGALKDVQEVLKRIDAQKE